jgi:hypothetical protein
MPLSAPGKFKYDAQGNTYGGAGTGADLLAGADDNLMIGRAAGANITDGDRNTVIGAEAGLAMLSNTDNVIVGANAAKAITLAAQAKNVVIGNNAASEVAPGDTFVNNTIIGYESAKRNAFSACTILGYNIAPALTAGSVNSVVIGDRPCAAAQSLQNVIVIGDQSTARVLQASATHNIILSTASGARQLTTGNNNIVAGEQALRFATDISYVVALGSQAARSAWNGVTAKNPGSILIGYKAGVQFRGNDMVAIGYRAGGMDITTQDVDTQLFIGTDAGLNNFGGAVSFFIGHYAGDAVTNGEHNMLVGHFAGSALTTGDRNLCIGQNAGDAITTGNDNLLIGYGIDAGATDSDTFRVGNANTPDGLLDGKFTTLDRQINFNAAVKLRRAAKAATGNGGDEVVLGCTASNITLTLTSAMIARAGRVWIVKDESGTAGGGSPITIETQGAETIDGQPNAQIIAPYGVARLYSDGSNLFSW